MELRVQAAKLDDVYRDIIRIPEELRRDEAGRIVPENTLCEVRIGKNSVIGILRGTDMPGPNIFIDGYMRERLEVKRGYSYDVHLNRVSMFRQYWWALSATDLTYRIPAHLALLSIVLGALALALGLFSVWLAMRAPIPH